MTRICAAVFITCVFGYVLLVLEDSENSGTGKALSFGGFFTATAMAVGVLT